MSVKTESYESDIDWLMEACERGAVRRPSPELSFDFADEVWELMQRGMTQDNARRFALKKIILGDGK